MVILSITLVYAAVFYLLYDKTRHGVVTNVNLIPILLLSWIWGVKAGLLVMLINSLICSGIIIRIITPDAIIGIEAVQAMIIHFSRWHWGSAS